MMDNIDRYDEMLTSILVNEKSILGFLSAIFNFLARRTDFYHVPEGPYENMGFPPGVAEDLVIKILRNCDPKIRRLASDSRKPLDVNNDIMCSTVAQEVEVVADNDSSFESDQNSAESIVSNAGCRQESSSSQVDRIADTRHLDPPEDYPPPVIPVQTNSESYNGAVRDNYSWSQAILELDVTVKLPPTVKKSKDLQVKINSGDICVACRNGDTIVKDTLPYKIKTSDSFWSISEGKLLIHLEKVQERWWDRLLTNEEPIDLSKIDCSRPLDELPDDHIDKVRELQWNQEQKIKGQPTSDELRNIDILKRAWNAEGSPFKGRKFDPSVLHVQPNLNPI